MQVKIFDHLVLTVTNTQTTCQFYERVLGMSTIIFGDNRNALEFGQFKINLHQYGEEFEPKANHPTPGSADLCLITDSTSTAIAAHLKVENINIEQGPVTRTGANGPIVSYYFRDPDGNLLELATYNK